MEEDVIDGPSIEGTKPKYEKEVNEDVSSFKESDSTFYDDAPSDGISLTAKIIMVVIAIVVFSVVLAPIVSQMIDEQVSNQGVEMSLYKGEDIEYSYDKEYSDGTPIILSDVVAVKYMEDKYVDKVLKYPKGYYVVGTDLKVRADSIRITTEGNELNLYFGTSDVLMYTSEYQWVFVNDEDGQYRATASAGYSIKINDIDNVYVVGDSENLDVYWSYHNDDFDLRPTYNYPRA